MGPVQVLVVAFDEPTFSGEVLTELTKLREAGIVRLIDVLVVTRAAGGTLDTLDVADDVGAGFGHIAAALFGEPLGELSGTDGSAPPGDAEEGSTWSLADAIPPGSAAAVALIEHLWAAPLSDAIRRAGGEAVEETGLAPEDVAALEALLAQQ
jgi:uncharacterized membrane protein